LTSFLRTTTYFPFNYSFEDETMMKTGRIIAAAAAGLLVAFVSGCATQTDTGAPTTATPGVAQTSCGGASAKDRMSCKGRTSCKGQNSCRGTTGGSQ
jgi:hypothetical protein